MQTGGLWGIGKKNAAAPAPFAAPTPKNAATPAPGATDFDPILAHIKTYITNTNPAIKPGVLTASATKSELAETQAFFDVLNKYYAPLKSADLGAGFWNTNISSGITVADMYTRGVVGISLGKFVETRYAMLDTIMGKTASPPTAANPYKPTAADALDIYKILTSVNDVPTDSNVLMTGRLTAFFVVFILTRENLMFKEADVANDAAWGQYLSTLIDGSTSYSLGQVAHCAWALANLVSVGTDGKLGVKPIADLTVESGFFHDSQKRIRQMRDFNEIPFEIGATRNKTESLVFKNTDQGLLPHVLVHDITRGILALHAYRTAAMGISCPVPASAVYADGAYSIKCYEPTQGVTGLPEVPQSGGRGGSKKKYKVKYQRF